MVQWCIAYCVSVCVCEGKVATTHTHLQVFLFRSYKITLICLCSCTDLFSVQELTLSPPTLEIRTPESHSIAAQSACLTEKADGTDVLLLTWLPFASQNRWMMSGQTSGPYYSSELNQAALH